MRAVGREALVHRRKSRINYCLFAAFILAAAVPALAQQKHQLDPMLPGSLKPEPLPPLENPGASSTPAKELFARKATPSRGPSRSIGIHSKGCLAGAVPLPLDGPGWQVMRPSRNRYWGNPQAIRFVERFAKSAKKIGWNGLLIGDIAQPRGGPMLADHSSHQNGLDVDIWFMPKPDRTLTKEERENISATSLVAKDGLHVNENWSASDAAFIRTAAEQPEVERVLVNAAIKKQLCTMQGSSHPSWMDKVRPWYGHHDHIHVRLRCPTDSPSCRPQTAVPG